MSRVGGRMLRLGLAPTEGAGGTCEAAGAPGTEEVLESAVIAPCDVGDDGDGEVGADPRDGSAVIMPCETGDDGDGSMGAELGDGSGAMLAPVWWGDEGGAGCGVPASSSTRSSSSWTPSWCGPVVSDHWESLC